MSLEEKKGWLTVENSVSEGQLIEAIRKAGPYTGMIIEQGRNTQKP